MLFKLKAYYKVNKNFTIYIMPVIFLLLTILVLLSAKELSDRNIGVVFSLFGPVMFISLITKILTIEYGQGFDEIMSSYPEPRFVAFLYKYLLAFIVFCGTLLCATVIALIHRGGVGYSLLALVGDTLGVAFGVGNFAALIAVWAKSFEQGLIAGLLAIVAIMRIPLSGWVTLALFPILAILFGLGAIWFFSIAKGGKWDEN